MPPNSKLRVRVVRVGVVVENVRGAESADGEGQPRNVLFARERELAVGHVLLFPAQAEGLTNEQVREP